MKAPEMREMTLEELTVHHDSLIDELVNLRMKLSIKQLDNPKRVTYLRREIARAKTILKDKVGGAKPGEIPSEAKEA
ncbi:MAG: 50S ribosomal protein L29 [Candidatus Latescibacterota bacterium]